MSYITFPRLGLELLFSRTAFTVFGKNIYWYGIIIAFGFALALLYAMTRCHDFGLDQDTVVDYLIWGTVFGIIGARLYYVVFNFSSFKDDLISVFYIWNGGVAIYGSIIGAFASGLVVSKVKKRNPFRMFDLASIGFLIGQIVGRWGNFANAEAYGKAFASQEISQLPFWAMGIGYPEQTYVHPIFLYESLWNLVGLLLILFVVKPRRRFGGEITLFYFTWYGFGRFFTEWIRGGDSLYLFNTPIRVSQALAAVLFLGGVLLFTLKFTHREKAIVPGMSPVIAPAAESTMEEKISLWYPEKETEVGEETGDIAEESEETAEEETTEETEASEEMEEATEKERE